VRTGQVPRVALGKEEAAAALGVSLDTLERHVWPDLRVIPCGGRKLVRVGELERWAQENEGFSLRDKAA
jgi:hypothetical protein